MPRVFGGEEMVCVMCRLRVVSDPSKPSNWRCIEADGVRYYACPAHFPADTASAEAFEQAYRVVLDKVFYEARLWVKP